jgi:hypothetical protein
MKIKVRIQGVTPLIMNRFHDEAAQNATAGTSGASTAQARGTPLEIAEKKLYLGLNGKPMIPQPNLLRCLVDGGYFHKAGKRQITTKKTSLLYAALDIEGAEIKLTHKEPWRVDTRAVVIPSTGGRILCHRPMFDDWQLDFVLEVDTTIINVKLLRQIVDDAGSRIGLGDFRPQCKGPYGRFKVTLWQEIPVALKEAAE